MSNKQDINNLITRFHEIEKDLGKLKNELICINLKLPDMDISNETKTMVTLKYDEITASDVNSWEKIKHLPEQVLVKWEQRLWIESHFNSKDVEKDLGERGSKQVRSWLWYVPYYLKSIQCNTSETDRYLSSLRRDFNKSNISSQKYIQKYFDMLGEEILSYENN